MRYSIIIPIIFFSGLAGTSHAATDHLFAWAADSPDFAMHISGTESDVDYDEGKNDSPLQWLEVGISAAEHVLPGIKMRLHGSVLHADQEDRSASTGLDLSGYSIGLDVEGELNLSNHIAIEAMTGLTFYSVSDEIDDYRAELEWLHLVLKVGGSIRTDHFSFNGGYHFQKIKGEEEVKTGSRSEVDFEESDTSSAYLGITFRPEPTAYITLTAYAGAMEKIELILQRKF